MEEGGCPNVGWARCGVRGRRESKSSGKIVKVLTVSLMPKLLRQTAVYDHDTE